MNSVCWYQDNGDFEPVPELLEEAFEKFNWEFSIGCDWVLLSRSALKEGVYLELLELLKKEAFVSESEEK